METMRFFEELKRDNPDIVETFVAQEAWPEILPSAPRDGWAQCEGEPCKTLVVRIGNNKTLTETSPEVFFSGALHGDERIGPLTVTELAGFLCQQYREGNSEVRRLVDSRGTWIMPMTNAHGYAHRQREEVHMDPNRDFGYLQHPENCMRTQTARAVNELFRRHLFHFMITFHGGMRALTYEWGSRNHLAKRHGSTESPDDHAFTTVGKSIQSAAGREKSSFFYPLGRISDLVYPVDGGMEDWSYGAGWEQSPNPITVCRPKTYGGYAESRTRYKPGSIATLVYLAEMDDAKTPRENTLGRAAQLWENEDNDGHVARNMRMCLKLIELAKAEVIVQPPAWGPTLAPQSDLALELHGFGCLTVSSARLLLVPRALVADCAGLGAPRGGGWDAAARREMLEQALEVAALPGPTACRGLTIWDHAPDRGIVRLRGLLPSGASGEFCAVVAAEFDQDWGTQSHPDPAARPRALASRARLEEHFEAGASDGPMRIDDYRTKLFAVQQAPLRVEGPAARAGPVAWPDHAQPLPPLAPGPAQPAPAAAMQPPHAGIAATAPAQPLSLQGLRGTLPPCSAEEAAWTLLSFGLVAAALCACILMQGLALLVRKATPRPGRR